MKPSIKERGSSGKLCRIIAIAFALKCCSVMALFTSKSVFDTSSRSAFSIEETPAEWSSKWTQLASRLMAWDAVYFVGVASKGGPTFEHEYAFSPLWAALIRHSSPVADLTGLTLTASVISFVSHLSACALMFALAQVKRSRPGINPSAAASIYSASPAGIFLISGYTESSCAALTFLGLVLLYRKQQFILAGIAFGSATVSRSNGLFWGICYVWALLNELQKRAQARWTRVIQISLGGSILGLSFVFPQYIAYMRFCSASANAPAWCYQMVPSIYTYVQAKYWNNGFLRYWTVSNIPSFLLALPSLTLLASSTKFLWQRNMRAIAAVQGVVLIGLTLFWHVQIVTRISSGLPGPALYLSDLLVRSRRKAQIWIGICIIWSITQAGLYGAFLPPA